MSWKKPLVNFVLKTMILLSWLDFVSPKVSPKNFTKNFFVFTKICQERCEILSRKLGWKYKGCIEKHSPDFLYNCWGYDCWWWWSAAEETEIEGANSNGSNAHREDSSQTVWDDRERGGWTTWWSAVSSMLYMIRRRGYIMIIMNIIMMWLMRIQFLIFNVLELKVIRMRRRIRGWQCERHVVGGSSNRWRKYRVRHSKSWWWQSLLGVLEHNKLLKVMIRSKWRTVWQCKRYLRIIYKDWNSRWFKQSLQMQKIWFENEHQLKVSSKQTNKRLLIRIVDKQVKIAYFVQVKKLKLIY